MFYSLAVSKVLYRLADERSAIAKTPASLPIDSLWTKNSRGGALSRPAVRNLVNGAAEFRSLGIPVVGDTMGGLRGLSALAFGAMGGICFGVTQKERFAARSLMQNRSTDKSVRMSN